MFSQIVGSYSLYLPAAMLARFKSALRNRAIKSSMLRFIKMYVTLVDQNGQM